MDILKKKILFIITKSNMGGAQRYVYELATNLERERFAPMVACGGNGLLKKRLEEAHIPTFTIKSFERDINIVKEFQSMRELYSLMRRERPDIVHLNSSKAGGSGALIARLCGVKKIIFTAHGWPFYEDRSFVWRSLVWFFSYLTTLLVHHVIVVSAHDERGARMPGLTKKIVRIHTALPVIEFESREDARATLFSPELAQQHAHDLWLVSTGEHTQNKNLEVLIAACKILKERGRKNFFLTLMSDGELRAHLESLVVHHALQDTVHFTGFVPEARLFLPAFDVFLMPSKKEGFPYGLLEAGAAGLAPIVSRVGGIPELIAHTQNGILLEQNDAIEIADAIEKCIITPSLVTTYGKALETRVVKEFSIATMLKSTIAVYDGNGSRAS